MFIGQTATSGNTMRIMPWAVADVQVGSVGTASTTQFLTLDATHGVRPLALAETSAPAANAAVTTNTNTRVVNAGVNSGAAASALSTTTINSLTFETGGALVINNFRDLRLDSGGILAKSSNTITVAGTGLGVGAINARDAGTTARTFFVHVMGAGNTLTSNATFGGVVAPTSGGLSKTGDGKLLLNSASGNNYTGLTTISLGTLELAAAAPNNALFYRFATSGMNATTTGDNDDALAITAGGTLELNGNSQIFGDLLARNATVGSGGVICGARGGQPRVRKHAAVYRGAGGDGGGCSCSALLRRAARKTVYAECLHADAAASRARPSPCYSAVARRRRRLDRRSRRRRPRPRTPSRCPGACRG
jgi:autotransporter-associated beta strand protein